MINIIDEKPIPIYEEIRKIMEETKMENENYTSTAGSTTGATTTVSDCYGGYCSYRLPCGICRLMGSTCPRNWSATWCTPTCGTITTMSNGTITVSNSAGGTD